MIYGTLFCKKQLLPGWMYVCDAVCDMVVWAEPRAMKVDHIQTVTHEQTTSNVGYASVLFMCLQSARAINFFSILMLNNTLSLYFILKVKDKRVVFKN